MTTIRTLAAELVVAAAVFAVGAAAGAAVVVFADISGYEHEAEIKLANSKGHDLMAIASVGRIATRGAAQSAVRCTCRPAPGVPASAIWQVLARHGLNRLGRL